MNTSAYARLAVIAGLVLSISGGPRLAAQSRDQTTPAVSSQAGTLSLTGRVLLDGVTPESPLRRARVTLSGDGAQPARIADTDTDGSFHFDRLSAGTYRILVEKPGFIMVERGPARGAVRPMSIALSESTPANLTIPVQRASAIEGQLLGEKGEPAPNVVVSAVRLMYGPYGRRPVTLRQATTDDLGRFRIHTLPSGDYYVEASPDPSTGVTAALPADRQGYARSFFPGTARVDEARIVTLSPGQDLSNQDFRISTVRLSTVSGTITDGSGRVPAASGLRLQRMGAPPGEVRGLAVRPGEFLFPAVPPGEYWLLGTTRSAPAADPEYASMRVIVAGEDLDGLRLQTAKGTTVNGRIEVEGSAALPPNLQLQVVETQFELPATTPPAPASTPAPGALAADGTFTLPSVFGPRLFRVDRLPPNWALKSVLLDGVDVSDTPVDFGAAPQPRALRLIVTNRTASVSGSLEAQTGGPAAGRVIVFAEDPRRWGMRARMIKTVEVQADGRYSVTGLPAGRYYLAGVEDLDESAWLDPEVLGRMQATATPIVLAEGQRITLTLLRR